MSNFFENFDGDDGDDDQISDSYNLKIFKKVKNKVSKYNYVFENIRDIPKNDLDGFCSAGILLENEHNEFLAIKEFRNGKNMWNLIGGKRNNIHEQPSQTALREFEEETSNRLSFNFNNFKKVIWVSESKYFLYNIYIKKKKITIYKKKPDLKWFSLDYYNENDFHPFANIMINTYKNFN